MLGDRKHSIANHVVIEFFYYRIDERKKFGRHKVSNQNFSITASLVTKIFWSPQGLH
jgi:hypothetical protein